MIYILAPFIGWLIAGSIKFLINFIKFDRDAFEKIGNGGFPSTHTTIVTSEVMLIGFENGFNTPYFGLGVAFVIIVIIDATGLRRHVGYHATHINEINLRNQIKLHKLRESMGHTKIEILGGFILGSIIGFCLSII